MAVYEGILATCIRITEAGDTRITEAGDTRILEYDGEVALSSDSVLVQWDIQGVLSESVGVSDKVSVEVDVSIAESVVLGDSLLVGWDAQCGIAESSTVDDALLVNWDVQCALSESVGLSDAYVLARIYDKTLSESIGVSDALSVAVDVTLSESVATSDAVTVSGTLVGCWLTIEGNETFVTGDILRIKDGTYDEWLEVLNATSAPIYRVIRDKAGSYADGSNPAWPKGASVVNYGASGSGGLYLTASETNAPYLSIFTHAGSPWSTITTHIREGNLNGYAGYSSDIYGWAAYIDADNYIKIDPTNGIRMSGEIIITGGSGIASFSDAGALAVGDTLDDVPNGSSYGRVALTAISAGRIVVAGLDSGVTERIFTNSGIQSIIENWRHADDLTLIDGGDIYANTITADKFISTLYGDLNQAMSYVKSVLGAGDEYDHDVTDADLAAGADSTIDADTHADYGISIRIATATEWDDGGAVWDTGSWDEVTDASGNWTSASGDMGSSQTLQLAFRFTVVEDVPASTTPTITAQYSTNDADFGANSPTFDDNNWETLTQSQISGSIYKAAGSVYTFRYFKVKVALATTDTGDRIILHTMTYLGNIINLFGQIVNQVIAAAGGTEVSYSGFNATPAITVTPVGAVPLVPVITAQSSTAATIKLFSVTDPAVDVGGNCNITIIGV